MKKDGLDERRTGGKTGWTRVDDYVVALARRRTARQQRESRRGGRFEMDVPRPTIGMVPFLIMMAAFALLAVAIAAMAWPRQHADRPKPTARVLGTAPPGWIDRALQDGARRP